MGIEGKYILYHEYCTGCWFSLHQAQDIEPYLVCRLVCRLVYGLRQERYIRFRTISRFLFTLLDTSSCVERIKYHCISTPVRTSTSMLATTCQSRIPLDAALNATTSEVLAPSDISDNGANAQPKVNMVSHVLVTYSLRNDLTVGGSELLQMGLGCGLYCRILRFLSYGLGCLLNDSCLASCFNSHGLGLPTTMRMF